MSAQSVEASQTQCTDHEMRNALVVADHLNGYDSAQLLMLAAPQPQENDIGNTERRLALAGDHRVSTHVRGAQPSGRLAAWARRAGLCMCI